MGLIQANARLLLSAKRKGVCFDRVLTIGRQQVFLRRQELDALSIEFAAASLKDQAEQQGEFCEPFLQHMLGADTIDSVDYSDFEGATITHDLNLPVDSRHHQKFDAVIDGGTLEHLFHVPNSLANMMRMTRVGGNVFLFTNANNHCGHGFYQFSPEFFYRVFQPENGFEMESVVLVQHPYPGAEISPIQRCYEVVDPDSVGCRVGLVSKFPTMIMVHARRIAEIEPFQQTMPLQSDYQQRWKEDEGSDTSSDSAPSGPIAKLRRVGGNLLRNLYAKLPSVQHQKMGRQQLVDYSFRNHKFYREWKP